MGGRSSSSNIGSAGTGETYSVVRNGEVLFTGTEQEAGRRIAEDMSGELEMYPQSGRSRTTAEERNNRELARVERENRTNAALAAQDLRRNEVYDIQWGREVRQGTFIGNRMINGIPVSEFRSSNGSVMRLDSEDVRRDVRRRRRS